MWVYYFVVIYAIVITGFVKPITREKKEIKLLMVLVPIFIFAAIRGNGYGDYFSYINRGQYLYSFNDVFTRDIGMEFGYKLFAYIIKLLGLPRQSIIIVFNLISAVCLRKFIKRYSNHWTMSFVLYLPIFFQFEMHAARAGVAISIVFLGMKYIENRQFLKYLFVVLLAVCFHTTAIIALVLYWMYVIKIEKKTGVLIIILDIVFVTFVGVDKIVTLVLSSLHLNSWLVKYVTYSNSTDYGYAMEIFDPRILIGILVYVICSIFIVEMDKMERFSINSTLLYTVLLIAFSSHTFIAYRLSSYFYYPMIILLPRLISDNKIIVSNKRGANILMFYSVLFLFTALSLVYASQNPEYIVFWKNGQALNPW